MPKNQSARIVGGQMLTTPEGKERIQFVLYDTEIYLAAGVGQLRFFQNIANKTMYETNLEQAGQLPLNNTFVIQEIFVKVASPSVLDANLQIIFKTSRPVVTFAIQNKSKFDIPLDMISGGNDLVPNTSVVTIGAVNGFQTVSNTWKLKVPITLKGLQNFSGLITFYTPTAVTVNQNIRFALKGVLERPQR